MYNFKIRIFLCLVLLLSTETFAKPRCDTAHLDICTRELLEGLIENNELNAHWDNGNYINGNLVVDGISYATTGFHAAGLNSVVDKHGWRWLSTNVFYAGNTGADILHATETMISDVAKFYMGGTWHTISAPMIVPPTPVMNVPTPNPSTNAAPPKIPIKQPMLIPVKPTQQPNINRYSTQLKTPPKMVQKVPTQQTILVPVKPILVSHNIGTASKHSKITLNNTHKQVAINYNHKHKNSVSNKKQISSPSTNVKSTVSLQVAKLHYKGSEKIDAKNVNKHLISQVPGNNVEENHHTILIDHDNKAWRCKVSGLGLRDMKDKDGQRVSLGHAETMHFRNSTFTHISNNIAINNNCLISVSK